MTPTTSPASTSPASTSPAVVGLDLQPDAPPLAPGSLKAILHPAIYWPEALLTRDVLQVETRDRPVVHVMNPALATAILSDDGEVFAKHAIYRHIAGGESGMGSMIAMGRDDARQAKMLFGPEFNPRLAMHHVPMIRAVTIRRADAFAQNPVPGGLSALLAAIALEIIWRVMFDPTGHDRPPPAFVETAIAEIYQARMAGEHRRVTALIRDLADGSIDMARSCPHLASPGSPFLPGPGHPLPENALRDNIRLFLSAGHKTSATAVGWTLWLLAHHPAAMAELRARLATMDPHQPVTGKQAETCLAAVHEAMRLFPPAVMTARQTRQAVRLGDLDLATGTSVVVNFYAMHRHRTFWPDPDHFRPERFLPQAKAPIIPGAYRPFSAGAHVCLGMKFAELETTLILAEFLRRFHFEPVEMQPRPVYSFTLHAWDGIPLSIHPIGLPSQSLAQKA
ncbi:MAG: cytochrome P450 [Gemmobacter sp.]|nr:cytochrome P450 [Gemmobacter sp.]